MHSNTKIIQDISLLYELSLSIGHSLDAHENCRTFLTTLMNRKSLHFAAVWLHKEDGQGGHCELFYMAPAHRAAAHQVACSHVILKKLREAEYLSISSNDEHFANVVQEKKVEKGSYALFRLNSLGFLKLYAANRTEGFSHLELAQLKNVVDKFAISLEGCLAHSQLREETEQRLLVQKALQRVNNRYADLFDNMQDALLVLDRAGNVVEANKAGKNLLGYRPDENVALNIWDVIHPADRERGEAFHRELREKGFHNDFEVRFINQNGEVRHIQVNASAIYENSQFAGSRDILRDVTEQKQVDRRVRESEATLRQVINYSLDAVVTIDGGGVVTEWSAQAESMFQFSREEAIGQRLSELIIPHRYREAHERGMAHFHRTGEGPVLNTRIEITALRKSGEEFPIELSIAAIKNDDGHFFSGFLRDITHRKQAEEALQNAQVRLTNLITNLQAGILLENEKREIVLTNSFFCEIFGIPAPPGALVGQDCSEAAEQSKHLFAEPESFVAGVGKLLQNKALVVGEPLEMANGAIFERDYIPLFSGEKYLGHLWQYHDVTEKRKAQQAILESEEKYRGIIENMELGLMEVDTAHNIVRPYQYFCEMVGYTAEELIGKNALELFTTEETRKTFRQQDALRGEGKTSVYEAQLRRKDGSMMWALISGAPVKDSSGKVIGSVGVHYDLTSRKKLEHDLAEAKQAAEHARLAERQFLANMSHEIRTPMNAVIGMTHLLYETDPTPTQKDYLDSLRFSADSLMGIIDNVLDLSKIEAGELELEEKSFNLAQLLKSLQRTFQYKVKDKSISVIMDFDPGIRNLVIGDPTRLNQILTNLLGNASKFTDRGTIGMRAKLLSSTAGKYLIEFRVHDTGIGISADKQEDIFKNFKQADVQVTRKYGGTGLGLTIVKQLVEMQGGSIRVDSRPGEGATFIFTLPLKNSGVFTTEQEEYGFQYMTDTRQFLKKLNLLVVEDNAMNQKLITKILDIWETRYEVANNGVEAVNASLAKTYDLVLMDIHMPEMDGVEAARLIRGDASNPNHATPIIALTAAALLEEKKRALDAGMNDFLTKPFSPHMLETCVLQVLGSAEPLAPEIPQPAPEGDGMPLTVDLQYLFEFSGGDRRFVLDMVDTFLAEMPAAIQKLRHETDAGNWEEVYKIVHKLKPNFMMLGMKAQQEKATEAERLLKNGAADAAAVSAMVNWLITSALRAVPMLEQQKSAL